MTVSVAPIVPAGWRPALAEAWLLVRGERKLLLCIGALVVVNRLAAVAPALASKIVLDQIVGARRTELLVPLASGLLAAALIEAGSGFAMYRAIGVASQRAITRLRTGLQAHVLRLPTGFFDEGSRGALLSRLMADPEMVRDVLGPGLVQLVSGAATAVVAMALLVALDGGLAAVVLAVVILSLVSLVVGLSRLYRSFHAISELAAELTGRLAEALGGIRILKTFRAERREAYAFARGSHRLLRAFVGAFSGVGAVLAVSALATGLSSAVVLVLGGRAVAAGRLTAGDLVLYLFLAGLLAAPILQMSAHLSELGRATAALGRIAELKAVAVEDAGHGGRGSLSGVAGAVRFEDVGHAYHLGHWALRHVSFEAPAGSTVAMVGPNGSGKTTVLRLLGGLMRPVEGRILVDGHDLATVRLRAWRAHVAAVLQEPFLFDGTVADNIAYGRPGASPAEIRRAGRLAHCDEFVGRLPDGYAARVGELGMLLSGGQRQRVAIARALLADPRVLLLDEATAHLDRESEALVQDALRTLRAGRTTFVIGHRLEAVRHADQILVLDGGSLVDRGTHEALLARQGSYWRLMAGHDSPESRPAEGVA